MKRYVRAATDNSAFTADIEQQLIEGLKAYGLTDATLAQMHVDVSPAGSGFKATIILPSRVSNGKKFSTFFYRRDAEDVVDMLLDSGAAQMYLEDLAANQDKLLQPARKKSSTAIAVSEARNTRDPEVLRRLSQHNAKTVRQAVAKNPYTPDDVLLDLLGQPDVAVNLWDIQDKNKLYEFNLIHNYMEIWRHLANSDRTPSDLLARMIDDVGDVSNAKWYNDPFMDLAGNENAPAETLWRLFEDPDWKYDWRLSLNRNLPLEIAEALIARYENEGSDAEDAKRIASHCKARLEGKDPHGGRVKDYYSE